MSIQELKDAVRERVDPIHDPLVTETPVKVKPPASTLEAKKTEFVSATDILNEKEVAEVAISAPVSDQILNQLGSDTTTVTSKVEQQQQLFAGLARNYTILQKEEPGIYEKYILSDEVLGIMGFIVNNPSNLYALLDTRSLTSSTVAELNQPFSEGNGSKKRTFSQIETVSIRTQHSRFIEEGEELEQIVATTVNVKACKMELEEGEEEEAEEEQQIAAVSDSDQKTSVLGLVLEKLAGQSYSFIAPDAINCRYLSSSGGKTNIPIL
jgi:hypothetical protein